MFRVAGVTSKMRSQHLARNRQLWREIVKHRRAYLYISPFFILFAIFGVYPIVYSFVLSLNLWHSTKPWVFVGLGNYLDLLLRDPVFWTSLWNVVYILLLNVPLMTLLALILAVVLNSEYLKLKDFFRVTYLIPYVTSVLSISIVFYVLFDDHFGLINLAINAIGLPGVQWLTSPSASKISIVIVVTWKWVGYNMIIALAGLQNISPDIYDAAKIDGANKTTTFLRITIPLIRPVVMFLLIMSTIGTFNMFTEPYILTDGGPGYSSTTMVLHLYRTSFKYFKLGYGSSIAFVTFLFILIPSLIQVRYMAKRD